MTHRQFNGRSCPGCLIAAVRRQSVEIRRIAKSIEFEVAFPNNRKPNVYTALTKPCKKKAAREICVDGSLPEPKEVYEEICNGIDSPGDPHRRRLFVVRGFCAYCFRT